MRRWRNRQKRNRKGHDRAAVRRDRGLIRERTPHRGEETIPHAQSIECATWPAPCRARTQATDRSRNRRAPTIHFAARLRATDSAKKIPWHTPLIKRAMVQDGGLPKRAREISSKTGSAWRNTTTLRLGT